MTMEELVERLAELQSDLEMKEDAAEANELVIKYSEKITHLEKELKKLQQARAQELAYYAPAIDDIKVNIEEIKKQIIEAWDGDKKTLKFDVGTLKFRMTSKLEIYHPEILLADMFVHLQTGSQMLKYLSGFNKTAVKKYIGVHPQDADIVELIATTSVKLEEEAEQST